MPTDKTSMGESFHLELRDKDGKLKGEIKKFSKTALKDQSKDAKDTEKDE